MGMHADKMATRRLGDRCSLGDRHRWGLQDLQRALIKFPRSLESICKIGCPILISVIDLIDVQFVSVIEGVDAERNLYLCYPGDRCRLGVR